MRSFNVFQLTAIWGLFGLLSLVFIRASNPIQVSPQVWHPKKNPARTGIWAGNHQLTQLKTDISNIPKHDTVVTDYLGRRYAGTEDGRILRWTQNGNLETFMQLTGRAAGMSFDNLGNLFVVEENAAQLWRISPQRTTVQLPRHSTSLQYLNDVTVANNGLVFATQSSTKWPLSQTSRAVMEHNNDGAVYMWAGKRKPKMLASGLAFPNGITVAHDQQSVLVSETTEYRVSRIWIYGKKAGTKEVVLDNLPGFPSDITPAGDGKHYWGTLFDFRHNIPLVDKLAAYPWARRVLLNMPDSWFPKNKGTPAVFLFDDSGNIKRTFQAPEHTLLPGFSSVVQHKNQLILSTANPLDHHEKRVFSLNLTQLKQVPSP